MSASGAREAVVPGAGNVTVSAPPCRWWGWGCLRAARSRRGDRWRSARAMSRLAPRDSHTRRCIAWVPPPFGNSMMRASGPPLSSFAAKSAGVQPFTTVAIPASACAPASLGAASACPRLAPADRRRTGVVIPRIRGRVVAASDAPGIAARGERGGRVNLRPRRRAAPPSSSPSGIDGRAVRPRASHDEIRETNASGASDDERCMSPPRVRHCSARARRGGARSTAPCVHPQGRSFRDKIVATRVTAARNHPESAKRKWIEFPSVPRFDDPLHVREALFGTVIDKLYCAIFHPDASSASPHQHAAFRAPARASPW